MASHARFAPVNVVALDQEERKIRATINDTGTSFLFDPAADLDVLPAGGGYVVADVNTWSVRNDYSVSQYCWESEADLAAFLAEIETRGYRARAVSNKLTNTLYLAGGLNQCDAVLSLAADVHAKLAASGARLDDTATADAGPLWCGCRAHGSYDSGHRVRLPSQVPGDRSFGQRRIVERDFLRMQNSGAKYETPFIDAAIGAVWPALTRDERTLLNFKKTKPSCAADARNRLAAIAVCTHDPATGLLRRHDGEPWGTNFIVRHVIGLNGTMRGTGERGAGNPMRAVLRVLGRRSGEKANPAERAALDRVVRQTIRALREHPELPAAW